MAPTTSGPPKAYNDVLEAIGNTPLIRLNRLTEGLQKSSVWVKLERCNPGGSIKDRIGLQMVPDAEAKGLLKPGGVIVEATSGNTGIGLAIVAAQRGYRCIFTIPDKMSEEKITLLKAIGAEVHVCPTAVEKEDPRSYYEVAARLAREVPGAWYPDQYSHMANPRAHELQTGPEIWAQTGGNSPISSPPWALEGRLPDALVLLPNSRKGMVCQPLETSVSMLSAPSSSSGSMKGL